MTRLRLALWIACAAVAPGCGTTPIHVEGLRPECENLDVDDGGCLLPWPSTRFLTGAGTPTQRIALPAEAMPENSEHIRVSTHAWNARDGFSAMTSMIVRLEGDVNDAPLASWREIDQSLTAGSPTILLDTTAPGTTTRVAHFAEVQPDDEDPAHTTLYLRPAQRLEERHHYVVGVRMLTHPDGTAVRSSRTFAALREGTITDNPLLEARRQHFETEVFGPLSGIAPRDSSLIVAWDFWTGTGPTEELVAMRDEAMGDLAGLGCAIDPNPVPTSNPGARLVTGHFDVPYFLDAACPEGALIGELTTDDFVRDGAGLPTSNGRRCQARFWALVPASAVGAGAGAVHVVQYGHGLTNGGGELDIAGVLAPILEQTRSVGIATDFIGLSDFPLDQSAIVHALLDLSEFDAVDHRVMQGIVAQLVLPHVFTHTCAALIPEIAPGSLASGPTRWVGNSEGGIYGPTVAALALESDHYDRLALGVGGISYPIMLLRSCDWSRIGLDALFASAYERHLDRDLLMVMFASHWDLHEGATFAPHVAGVLPPLPGSATTLPQILFQTAVNDLGTPEVSGEIAARTMDLPYLSVSSEHVSSTRPTATASGASPPSAFVSFTFPDSGMPPDGPGVNAALCSAAAGDTMHDPHERVRRDPHAQAQIVGLFNTGTIP